MEIMRGKLFSAKGNYIFLCLDSVSYVHDVSVTGELRVTEKAGIEDKTHQATVIKCTQQT